MIGLLRAEPDTGPIGQPETPTWRLALRHFESFPSPDPLHAFMIHAPTVVVQQGGDPPIPIAPILARQLDDRRRQRDLIVRGIGLMVGVELVADRSSRTPFPRERQATERVVAAARDAGLLLYSSTGHVEFIVPARIPKATVRKIQAMAAIAYKAIDASGLSRVDFFLQPDGELLINEINTLPGLTDVSGFPKMWEATGIPFRQVIDQLVEFAIERHRERARNETSI
jgi:hypothetical protein